MVRLKRSATAALFVAGFAGPALADQRDDWDKAPVAELVAKGKASLVYRFVDEVDGKKVVCYFVDSYYSTESGKGGITCVPKP